MLILNSSQAQYLKFKHRNHAFQAGFEYVQNMWFSPDEKFTYTASDGGVGVFEYNAETGYLTLQQLHNMQEYGYESSGAENIVFSHDGAFAYTVTSGTTHVHYWSRDTVTGRLTFLGQVPGTVDPFGYVSSLCISPDNKFLYVGSGLVVIVYSRDLANGSLTLVKREWEQARQNDIYISKDGKFMYLSGDYVRVFTRNQSTGLFTLLGEYIPWSSESGITTRFTSTPDEKFIYAGTRNKGIVRFERDGLTGKLTSMKLFNYPTGNISNPLGPAEINGLRINSVGSRLYVSSYLRLSAWSVDAAGELTLLHSETPQHANLTAITPYFGVAVSRDDQYVFGFGSERAETSVECFKANEVSTLDSVRIHYFNQTLNRGLFTITAEALSDDDAYLYVASASDQCFTAFQSGVLQNGEMKEINRIRFRDIQTDLNLSIQVMVTTADKKHLYAAGGSSLFIFNTQADGSIQYRETVDLSAKVIDLKQTHNGKYIFVSLANNTFRTYQRESAGTLTLKNIHTTSTMGADFAPQRITISANDQWLYLLSEDLEYSLVLYTFNLDSETGTLLKVNQQEFQGTSYPNVFTLLLSEKHQRAILAKHYPYFGADVFSWNPDSGLVGDRLHVTKVITLTSEYPAILSRDEEYLIVNGDDDATHFFGFQEDGSVSYAGKQELIGGVYWSTGGGESTDERYLIPSQGNLCYGIRQSGNGVYVYEFEAVLPPLPPHHVYATGGDRRITVTWDKHKQLDVVYHVYRKLTWHGDAPSYLTKVGETTQLQFIDTSAEINAPYYYFVQAVSSGKSSVMSLPSPSAMATDQPPAAPQNVLSESGVGFIKLTWSANAEDDLKNYAIYRNTTNNLSGASLLETTTTTSYVDQMVVYRQIYYYWIKAVDGSSESIASASVSGSPLDPPPAIPSHLELQTGDKYISLNWNQNIEPDFFIYEIYRGVTPDVQNAHLLISTTDHLFIDNAVDYLQTYYYFVRAIDVQLNASDFIVSSGMPIDNPPTRPDGLAVVINDAKEIVVSWLSNSEPDLKGYRIYRNEQDVPGEAILVHEQLVAAGTQFVDTSPHSSVYYWITAFDINNNSSAFSDQVQLIITGQALFEASDVQVYPNPVVDYLEIKHEDVQAEFTLVDVCGRLVLSGKVLEHSRIDCRNLLPGSYICQIKCRNDIKIIVIIKG